MSWERQKAALNTAVDRAFGEGWRLQPMGPPDITGPRPDPDRVVQDFTGVLSRDPDLDRVASRGSDAKKMRPGLAVSGGTARLSVAAEALAEPPRVGDVLHPQNRPASPAWRVVQIGHDGARLVLGLQLLGDRI